MVLGGEVNPHVVYLQTEEYYARNGGYPKPCREEYYATPAYGQQEDYCSENAYYNNFGSSVQKVRPYPNITTTQPSKHHVIHHVVDPEGYDQHNVGNYGNLHGHKDHDYYGYDKHSKKGAYHEEPHGYKEQSSPGYDKHSKKGAYHEEPHGYKEQSSPGFDKHSYGKYHTDGKYGECQSYDTHEGHGYAKDSNGPNRYASTSYNYHAEGCEQKGQQDWASKGAQWIFKGLDD